MISAILIIVLSIIDISNLNEMKLNKWGFVSFPMGKLFYYIVVALTILSSIWSIQKSSNVIDLEKEMRNFSL